MRSHDATSDGQRVEYTYITFNSINPVLRLPIEFTGTRENLFSFHLSNMSSVYCSCCDSFAALFVDFFVSFFSKHQRLTPTEGKHVMVFLLLLSKLPSICL